MSFILLLKVRWPAKRFLSCPLGPTIIAGFGYDTATTTLLSMAPGAAQVAGTFLALYVAKWSNRTVQGIYTLLLACIGVIMMLAIPSRYNSARYGGYILLMQCKEQSPFVL